MILRNIFFCLILFSVSSCILDNKKEAPTKKMTLDILPQIKEKDLNKDTTDYSKLVISEDSIDLALVRLIRGQEAFTTEKLLQNTRILIKKGANPNNTVIETWTSKRDIAKIPIVKHFVKRKYRTTQTQTTAFHSAVYSGNIDLVNLLFELGFDANTPTVSGDFPINLAIQNDDEKMIDFLIKKKTKVEKSNLSLSENTDLIVHLVNLGANPQTINLNYALEDIESLKKLLALKPNLKTIELDFEKLFANQKAFNLLMNNGLDPNISGDFPYNCTLIYGAVEFGSLENIKEIIAKGGDYKSNCPMEFYNSPLNAAIKVRDTTKIAYFIKLGLSPNKQDWKGETPFSEAISDENEEILIFLIKKGAKVNSTFKNGISPVMYAVKNDKYISTEVLIKEGAMVNSKDEYGKTCLAFAIENNNLAMIKLLLEAGANKTIKYKTLSLSDYAASQDASTTIVELLK